MNENGREERELLVGPWVRERVRSRSHDSMHQRTGAKRAPAVGSWRISKFPRCTLDRNVGCGLLSHSCITIWCHAVKTLPLRVSTFLRSLPSPLLFLYFVHQRSPCGRTAGRAILPHTNEIRSTRLREAFARFRYLSQNCIVHIYVCVSACANKSRLF